MSSKAVWLCAVGLNLHARPELVMCDVRVRSAGELESKPAQRLLLHAFYTTQCLHRVQRRRCGMYQDGLHVCPDTVSCCYVLWSLSCRLRCVVQGDHFQTCFLDTVAVAVHCLPDRCVVSRQPHAAGENAPMKESSRPDDHQGMPLAGTVIPDFEMGF